MKFILAFILSLSLSILAFAQQDSLGFTNKAEAENKMVNGVKEGKWLEYEAIFPIYENTPKVKDTNLLYYSLTIYKAGRHIGMVRVYYKSGRLLEEIPYSYNGEYINGVDKIYYENGKLKEEDPFKDGLLNGTVKMYDDKGTLIKEEQFKNDVSHGIARIYYPTGVLNYEEADSNGLSNGVSRNYYPSGKLYNEWTNRLGKKNGIFRQYYENGKLEFEKKYNNDMVVEIKNYDENGKEIK